VHVAGDDRVLDRLEGEAVVRVPLAGSAVKVGNGLRLQPRELAGEDPAEHLMEPIPTRCRAQRDEEDVRPV
jgi:hypothetical protein